MAIYTDQVLPRIVNRVMDNKMSRARRREVCAGLAGDVVEIGFGSGLNVPYYPATVTGVWAVEPATLGFRLAEKRLAASPVAVHPAGLDGQELDLPDDRFDSALSTWTLCTIPDADAALREVRRVLKPGGRLHFVEHGLSPDEKVAHRQHQFEPVQKRVAGGCHLTRDIQALIAGAGFIIEQIDRSYEMPKAFAYMYQGVARTP